MRRLLIALAAVVAMLSLLIVVSRLGGQQTELPAAAVLDPGTCGQPCWHGIQIGKTTFRQAIAALKADKAQVRELNEQTFERDAATLVYWNFAPESRLRWYGAIDIHTTSIDLPIRALVLWGDRFTLGEAMVLWGDPVALVVCPTNRINISTDFSPAQNAFVAITRRVWAVHAFFPGSIEVIAYGNEQSGGLRLNPTMPVNSIVYNDPVHEPSYRLDAVSWRGLARLYSPVASFCDAS